MSHPHCLRQEDFFFDLRSVRIGKGLKEVSRQTAPAHLAAVPQPARVEIVGDRGKEVAADCLALDTLQIAERLFAVRPAVRQNMVQQNVQAWM